MLETAPKESTPKKPSSAWKKFIGFLLIILLLGSGILWFWATQKDKLLNKMPFSTNSPKPEAVQNITAPTYPSMPQESSNKSFESAPAAAPAVDITSLIARLDAINQQILDLPVLPQTKPFQIAAPKTTAVSAKPFWTSLLNSFIQALKELVIIRPVSVEPLPLPEQLLTVRLNVQTKILQAEWAALHGNKELYQACLLQAQNWIKRYFMLNALQTTNILNALKELITLNVENVESNSKRATYTEKPLDNSIFEQKPLEKATLS